MIRLFIAACVAALGLASTATAAPFACDRSPIFVHDARLPGAPSRPVDMAVAEGRVLAVGRTGSVRRPKGARVIEAHGASLLPGLIDSHVHLRGIGVRLPPELGRPAREKQIPITASATLRSGVTTARAHLFDLEDGPWLKARSQDPCFPSPRLVLGGPGLTFSQPDMNDPQYKGFHDLAEAKARIAEAAAAGADWIAFHEVGKAPPEVLDALVAEAHAKGLQVMIGGDSTAGVASGLQVQARSIEYLNLQPDGDYALAPIRSAGPGVFFSPTLGVRFRQAETAADPALLDAPGQYEFMSPDLARAVREAAAADMAQRPVEERRKGALAAEARFKQLAASGARLVLATDSGSTPYWQREAVWWEMTAWRRAGVPMDRVLQAATVTPAEMLDLNDVGRLAPGMRADFVLYDGDLETGPLATDRVLTVAKDGVVFVEGGRWVGP